MLYSTHSYGAKECLWFHEVEEMQETGETEEIEVAKKAEMGEEVKEVGSGGGVENTSNDKDRTSPSLANAIDALITSLALSARSLELLRTALQRRSRGGSVSHSQSSQRGSSRSQSGQLHSSHASMDASSSSSEAYEKAMRNQIVHYAEVTRSASTQLQALLELNGQNPQDTKVPDWEMRSEDAIHRAVLSMARRASGLQALTSTCTTSPMARKHSSSHAQSLYEHSLCLLEDLLANAQQDKGKFMCLAALAEKITVRLQDLMTP